MHVSGKEEGTQMWFPLNKGSLCWALLWAHIVGPDPFDVRLAVSMVDSLALRVGESQLLAQGG